MIQLEGLTKTFRTADGTVEGVKAGSTRLAIKCAAKPSVRVTVDVTVTAS